MKMVDARCPNCREVRIDVLIPNLDSTSYPVCVCGTRLVRAWFSSAAITPNGTRPEKNTDRYRQPTVDTKRIAADTMQEVEQKWLRYSNPEVAEQHVSREINESAGFADAAGNEIPPPKPAPITFQVERG